jgi:hypothetical protein
VTLLYDGEFLSMDDILLAVTPDDALLRNRDGVVDARICNFELISSNDAPSSEPSQKNGFIESPYIQCRPL